MYKKFLIIPLIILFSSCSNNNSVVRNPITGEKSNPGLFSKDSDKGISLSDLLSPKDNKGISTNVNAYLWIVLNHLI